MKNIKIVQTICRYQLMVQTEKMRVQPTKVYLRDRGPPQDSNHGSSDASLGQDNENPWDLSMFNDMELDQLIIKHHPKNLQVINVIV
jgi:hypothetical protein